MIWVHVHLFFKLPHICSQDSSLVGNFWYNSILLLLLWVFFPLRENVLHNFVETNRRCLFPFQIVCCNHFLPPHVKSWHIRKDADADNDWRQEKGTTEDEMVGCHHHWFDGHEFEQAPGVDDVQGSLARCSPWSCKESDMPEQLNWTEITTLQFITFTKQSGNTKYE